MFISRFKKQNVQFFSANIAHWKAYQLSHCKTPTNKNKILKRYVELRLQDHKQNS